MIPARFRHALGLKPGDSVQIELEDGVLRLESRAARIKRAQALVAKYASGRSLADELIAERRAEAARGD